MAAIIGRSSTNRSAFSNLDSTSMSHLRNWLSLDAATSLAAPAEPRTKPQSMPGSLIDEEEDDGSETAGEDDIPPAFPAINSPQRASGSSNGYNIPSILTDSSLMPPPLVPDKAIRQPGVPQSKTRLTAPSSSLLAPMATTQKPKKPSKKVALAPGFGPLDWANLKASGEDLRGVDTLLRVPPSLLKRHNKKDDAWTAIYGKVYNITPYLPYHPGGEKELMRVAGRDGTELFALTHAWVNADFMLDGCLVGLLVSESAS